MGLRAEKVAEGMRVKYGERWNEKQTFFNQKHNKIILLPREEVGYKE